MNDDGGEHSSSNSLSAATTRPPAGGWSANGMTDRANCYLDELAAGRWNLPSSLTPPVGS